MKISDIEHFRELLLTRQMNLSEWLNTLNSQNNNEAQKAQALLNEIKTALDRVNDHCYGKCRECDGEMELHRLEIQPASQVCLDCISEQEKVQLEEELFLASKIHRALLPQTVAKIDGFEVAVRSLAAHNVGGDYYDFLPSNNGRSVKVVIADSMGKGLPAGLLMSNLQGALRILANDIKPTAKLVRKLNQWLCRNVPVTKFISLVCVELNLESKQSTEMILTNAGHCPPILIRADGTTEHIGDTGGVLGVDEGFDYEERRDDLAPGDMLLLFTDGISETANESGEMFGEDRVAEYARNHQNVQLREFLDGLIAEVMDFSGTGKLSDDTTVIVLRKNASLLH